MNLGIGVEILRGSGSSWHGGTTHFGDLMRALRATYPDRLTLYLVEALHGTPIPEELKPVAQGVVTYPTLKRGSATWAFNHARRRILRDDLLPDRVLKKNGVDVLVCGVLERQTTLPTLALIPDLQHRHFPQFFDPREIHQRDAEYLKTMARATRIFVSTESVRADLRQFAPQYADKVQILTPVSFIPEEIYARPSSEILQAYGLPNKFVYLPNQFWQHKNHLVAFDAVRQLKARGIEVTVVCTGSVVDWRNLDYSSEVLQTIAGWQIRENVILLGSVPRADVFGLMRQSICVLNPSLFEGFGLAIGEARGVGKRVLASDISAHREQNVPCAEYFNPNDAVELAQTLGAIWENTAAGPDLALEAQARQMQPQRVRAYAERFMQIVNEVRA